MKKIQNQQASALRHFLHTRADQARLIGDCLQQDRVLLRMFETSVWCSLTCLVAGVCGANPVLKWSLVGLSSTMYSLTLAMCWGRFRRAGSQHQDADRPSELEKPEHDQGHGPTIILMKTVRPVYPPTTPAEEIAAQEEYANEQLIESLSLSGFVPWHNQWVYDDSGDPVNTRDHAWITGVIPYMRANARKEYEVLMRLARLDQEDRS